MINAVIVDAVRTGSAKGKPGGGLSTVHPVDLLATVLEQLLERNGLDPAQVDDVIGGCVTQAGEQSLNVTRNAVLAAGFPETVPATTVDRQCGSSQQAAAFAAQGVIAGSYDIVIAAGVESMSRAPMFSGTQGHDAYGERIPARYPADSSRRASRPRSSPRGGSSTGARSMSSPPVRITWPLPLQPTAPSLARSSR
jgi:acetyl-CoA acyltransferase